MINQSITLINVYVCDEWRHKWTDEQIKKQRDGWMDEQICE